MAPPHSVPVEPAIPVHMPITRRRLQPVVQQASRLPDPTSLRRDQVLGRRYHSSFTCPSQE